MIHPKNYSGEKKIGRQESSNLKSNSLEIKDFSQILEKKQKKDVKNRSKHRALYQLSKIISFSFFY